MPCIGFPLSHQHSPFGSLWVEGPQGPWAEVWKMLSASKSLGVLALGNSEILLMEKRFGERSPPRRHPEPPRLNPSPFAKAPAVSSGPWSPQPGSTRIPPICVCWEFGAEKLECLGLLVDLSIGVTRGRSPAVLLQERLPKSQSLNCLFPGRG